MTTEVASAEEFAALALKVLLERVAASTGELGRLRGRLQRSVREPWSDSEELDLARACSELERQGWLFGLLARELGSDVLFERRERGGLDSALMLVKEMLRRDGVEFPIPDLPELDSNDERCTTICAVIARCVHAAELARPAVAWSLVRDGQGTSLRIAGQPAANLRRALLDGASRIAGAQLCEEPCEVRLMLPPECVRWP